MPKPSSFARLSLLLLTTLLASGCVSYRIRDEIQVQDQVLEDSCRLSVDLVSLASPNLRLSLNLDGEKKIQRTTITDRQVHYDVESTLIGGVEDIGFSLPLVFAIPAGLAADAAQLVLSAPTQIPAGLYKAIHPADQHSTVVEQQKPDPRPYQEVVVRFGPRLVETVQYRSDNEITVNARDASRTLLSRGETEMSRPHQRGGDPSSFAVLLNLDEVNSHMLVIVPPVNRRD